MKPPPPAILLAYCAKYDCWRATAVVDADADPGEIIGDSSMEGQHPAEALQLLLARRCGILVDQDCPPTLVSVAVVPEPEPVR